MRERKMETSFDLLRLELEQFVAERDWKQFHTPKNMATCIAVEAGELLEHYLWTQDGSGPFPKGTAPPEKSEVAAEAADIFMSLLNYCRVMDIDLIEVTREKLKTLETKYPVELSKGSAEKSPGEPKV